MFVPAFEKLTSVAEQNRTRCHQLASAAGAVLRPVLKTSCSDYGDGDVRVELLEWPVLRAGGADDILHAPSVALSQDPPRPF